MASVGSLMGKHDVSSDLAFSAKPSTKLMPTPQPRPNHHHHPTTTITITLQFTMTLDGHIKLLIKIDLCHEINKKLFVF